MRKYLAIVTILFFIHYPFDVGASHGDSEVVCRSGTNWLNRQDVHLDTSMKKYVGAVYLIFVFGTIAVATAMIYTAIRRYVFHEVNNTDRTFDAGGNVSTSLTAVSVASQLLWPGDVMQSVTVCVKYGIAGAFWYCSSAIINMSLFPVLSYKFKTRAPGAKTFLQIIRARYGTFTHLIFIFFALLVNLTILATVFVGSIAVIQATVSNANVEFCVIILAVLSGCYALIGGLGSTYYVSYLNLVTAFVVVSIFVLKVVYLDDEPFGSLRQIYDRVNCQPGIDGNRDGKHITFLSEEATIYGAQVLFLVSSVTYCDQASWQTRIAAKPLQGAIGILIGSFVWFSIPASIGLIAGVSYVAETARNQSFAMSIEQIDAGLVTSYMMEDAMGTAGAILMLTMLTMLTMSTGAAEIMAITSIIVYDIYQTYIRPFRKDIPLTHCICCGLRKGIQLKTAVISYGNDPKCSCPLVFKCTYCKEDEQNILNADKYPGSVVNYTCPHHQHFRQYQDEVFTFKSWTILWVTLALIPFGVLLDATDLDLNWTMMAGVILTVPSFPSVILAILWAKTSPLGMVIGSISGLLAGAAADGVVAVVHYDWDGGFIRATSEPYSVLAGSATGFFVSLIFNVIISLFHNKIKTQEDADNVWSKLREIDNPLQPWSLQFAKDFPELTDGSYRPSHKEMEDIGRRGKHVSIIGSFVYFLLFMVVTPCTLAILKVMSFDEFEVWTTVLTVVLFVSAVFVIVVPPFEEIRAIVSRIKENKRKNNAEALHSGSNYMNDLNLGPASYADDDDQMQDSHADGKDSLEDNRQSHEDGKDNEALQNEGMNGTDNEAFQGEGVKAGEDD